MVELGWVFLLFGFFIVRKTPSPWSWVVLALLLLAMESLWIWHSHILRREASTGRPVRPPKVLRGFAVMIELGWALLLGFVVVREATPPWGWVVLALMLLAWASIVAWYRSMEGKVIKQAD